MENTKLKYFNYLKKRTLLGKTYRKYYLYPKINQKLQGLTLDVGCGIGDMLRFRKNIIGVDVNPFNIDHCKLMGFNAYLIESNILPFDNNSFDSVLLDNVLEHIINPEEVLCEIHRVLKPNGKLIIGVPGILGFKSDKTHTNFYCEEDLIKLAFKTQYTVEEIFYTPLWKSLLLSKIIRQYCIYTVWNAGLNKNEDK